MKENKRNWIKHIFALLLFCSILSVGIISFADGQGTVKVKSAAIRASADAKSEQIGSVKQGKTVDIAGQTTGNDGKVWYQVYVDANTKGYIRSDLLDVKDASAINTIQGSASSSSSSNSSTTTATPVDAKKVTVKDNGRRIRSGASTNHGIVATVNKGMVLTVTGEAQGSDGKWYQVSFNHNDKEVTGFIRADLVTTDNVPADTATSEITGEQNPEEEMPPETEPVEEPSVEEPPAQPEPVQNTVTIMDTDEEPPYILPGFKLASLKISEEQSCKGYANGTFILLYGRRQDGEEGWFLCDKQEDVYQRYVYTAPNAKVPSKLESGIGLIPVIVLMVIVIILVAVIGLLLLKLRGTGGSYKDDDDDDEDVEYPEDDIEDLEELEEEEPKPVRRPQGPQPVRRPQPSTPQGPQPVRRPQGGGTSQETQPVRRPQGGNAPQGAQPPRRPQTQQLPRRPQGGGMPQEPQPPRRPQGGGAPQGGQPLRRPQPQQGPQPVRRPQPQGERVPNERVPNERPQGYKAKNLLEDDDMDFMDIE